MVNEVLRELVAKLQERVAELEVKLGGLRPLVGATGGRPYALVPLQISGSPELVCH